MDIENLKADIEGLVCPTTYGEFQDGWAACKEAVMQALHANAGTAVRPQYAKVGVSHDVIPLSSVREGDIYRLFDLDGTQLDQRLFKALRNAITKDGVTTVEHTVVI